MDKSWSISVELMILFILVMIIFVQIILDIYSKEK